MVVRPPPCTPLQLPERGRRCPCETQAPRSFSEGTGGLPFMRAESSRAFNLHSLKVTQKGTPGSSEPLKQMALSCPLYL